MSRRTTPSSDEFRDDVDYYQLTWENELAREQARQRRRRQAGQQRGLSERLEGHTTPLSVGVGRSPLVTPNAVRDALERAMEMSGVPTGPPAGVGVAPNVSSPSSGVPSVTTIRAATQDLPSPTLSPRQIGVMEQILRNEVPEDQIDALLDSVGLDFNQLTDYIGRRPPPPTLTARQIDVMERIARGNFPPGQMANLLTSVGLTKNQLNQYITNRPPTPRTPSPPPAPRGRGRPPPRGRGRGRGRGGVPPGGGGGDDDGGPPGGGGGGGGDRGGRRGRGRSRGTPPRRARMNQDELRRQMDLLAEDARQRSVGRRIADITHTNTVTTVYKDGGEPEVYRTSSRLSTPNTV